MAQKLVVLILFGYLFGSIPFSQLIAHARADVNLREVGEGNVGSRNVWHVVGPSWGLFAFLLDGLKGLAAYKAAVAVGLPLAGTLLVGVAVLLGHQFPIFLRGRGGKGLATASGVLIGISPLSTIGGFVVLGVAYLVLRDFNPAVTLGCIAVVVLPVVFRQPLWVPAYAVVLGLMLGAKKLLDRPHEARVWERQPWHDDAQPGFHRPADADTEAPAHDTPPH
ncbi:MAG TPA: glycerol-3-phosphate acyltransferase [Ktedonobacterales bacterium]|nr:glycerol-3-phosphate acyltransferase [Ktedonobacterales bacterium]